MPRPTVRTTAVLPDAAPRSVRSSLAGARCDAPSLSRLLKSGTAARSVRSSLAGARCDAPSLSRRVPARAALAAIVMLLAGCVGTPAQDGPTVTVPAFTGISATSTDHSVAVRDLYIPDPGPAGYPAGAMVPLLVQVWNNTNAPVSLTSATITGSAPATLIDPKGTAPAAVFDLPVRAGSSVGLSQQSGLFLQIQCAKAALTAGTDVPMTFVFSNGATITADVPIGHFPDPASTTPPVAAC